MRGMAACARLAELRSGVCEGGGEFGEVVRVLERVVGDGESTAVHIPATIALHSLERADTRTGEVLLEAVRRRNCDNIDEWAGLQCLVEGGVCDECVVEGLQRFLLNSSKSSVRERAGAMMARLSDRMVGSKQF